ncbi:MAG: TonB family protein [Candidatus Korobacteraceae bacterium]|jgi:TonB family protein
MRTLTLIALSISLSFLAATARAQAGNARPESSPGTTASDSGAEKPRDWKYYLKPEGSVKPPQVVEAPQPVATERHSGKVHYEQAMLRVAVNEYGTVDRVEVVKKVGYGLDEKAVQAVKAWKFKPATQHGRPVPVQVYVQVKFRLYK